MFGVSSQVQSPQILKKELNNKRVVNKAFIVNVADISTSDLTDVNAIEVANFINGDGVVGNFVLNSALPKNLHNGVNIISPSVPWSGESGADQWDFKAAVGEIDVGGNGCFVRQYGGSNEGDLNTAYVEQFISGCHGRGMLTAETNSIVTEQAITVSASAGDDTITVTDSSDFEEGGGIVVKHDNGRYEPYFIRGISGNNVTVGPALKYDASTTVERQWYNGAHPGKYYMRYLAQKIVLSPAYELELSTKRLFFSQFDSSDEKDVITPVSGGVINYYDASNEGGGTIETVPRFLVGKAASIGFTSSGDGGETFEFSVEDVTSALVRVVLHSNVTDVECIIVVVDGNGRVNAEYAVTTIGSSLTIPQVYNIPVNFIGDVESAKVQFIADTVVTPGAIIVDQVEVMPLMSSARSIISVGDRPPVIVGLGDSWIAGDYVTTAERESLLWEVQKLIPHAIVVNKGVGGEKVWQLVNRFDSDIVPENPDYVIVCVGTNDAYSPASGIFFPNAVDAFVQQLNILVNKIRAVGAKPIIIGVAGLKESDNGFIEWELNDRARVYSQYFQKKAAKYLVRDTFSRGDNASGEFIRLSDGTMICWREVSVDTSIITGQVFAFPSTFDNTKPVSVSFNIKTIQSGNTITAAKDAFVRTVGDEWIVYFPTAGSETETLGLMAVGRWF